MPCPRGSGCPDEQLRETLERDSAKVHKARDELYASWGMYEERARHWRDAAHQSQAQAAAMQQRMLQLETEVAALHREREAASSHAHAHAQQRLSRSVAGTADTTVEVSRLTTSPDVTPRRRTAAARAPPPAAPQVVHLRTVRTQTRPQESTHTADQGPRRSSQRPSTSDATHDAEPARPQQAAAAAAAAPALVQAAAAAAALARLIVSEADARADVVVAASAARGAILERMCHVGSCIHASEVLDDARADAEDEADAILALSGDMVDLEALEASRRWVITFEHSMALVAVSFQAARLHLEAQRRSVQLAATAQREMRGAAEERRAADESIRRLETRTRDANAEAAAARALATAEAVLSRSPEPVAPHAIPAARTEAMPTGAPAYQPPSDVQAPPPRQLAAPTSLPNSGRDSGGGGSRRSASSRHSQRHIDAAVSGLINFRGALRSLSEAAAIGGTAGQQPRPTSDTSASSWDSSVATPPRPAAKGVDRARSLTVGAPVVTVLRSPMRAKPAASSDESPHRGHHDHQYRIHVQDPLRA